MRPDPGAFDQAKSAVRKAEVEAGAAIGPIGPAPSVAQAEAVARITAARLAAAGQDVCIEILDRTNRAAGSRWFDAGRPFPREA